MDGVHLFTQDEKYLERKRKRLFLAIGLLPLLFVSVLMTWSGGRSGRHLGIGPAQVMLLIPVVLAFQFLVVSIQGRLAHRTVLRLSPEALVMETGDIRRRYLLEMLKELVVTRNAEKSVVCLSLRFAGERIRLEGYLGMDTLRDLLVRYAGTVPQSLLRVRDPQHEPREGRLA
jgi:hypothetical protein